MRHGAQVKRCSSDGCTSHAKKGGVCIRHGAKVESKRCSRKKMGGEKNKNNNVRFDEVSELAREAGADANRLLEIRNIPLSSGS